MKEQVLNILENEFDALDIMAINDRLGLTTVEELRDLQFAIDELVKELVVYQTKKNKYILYTKCPNFRKGKLDLNKKGNGFLVLEDEQDIFISKDALGYALDGDIVLVEILDFDEKRPEGKVIRVLERNLKNIVGEIKNNGKELYFDPKEKIAIDLIIDKESLASCVEGEIVVVSIIEETGKNKFLAEVSKHVCHRDDATQDILTIAAKYDIFEPFPEDVLDQIETIPNEVLESDRVGRVDLTNQEVFTIDGETAKDIDDAVSLEVKDGYYYLSVHIADVSYYVKENSPLDVEAFRRGTSSYLANSVIPQLPHKLSNGICSLNPDVDRCALTCRMKIDSRGHVVDLELFPSIIRSRKKMTYTAVNKILNDEEIENGYEPFVNTLKSMRELSQIIRDERTRRGASDFDIKEPTIVCDESGKAIDVTTRERGLGELIIEDFMIVSNESVAKTLENMGVPSIYRVHDIPKPEKIQAFINFCTITGHPIKGKFNKINPKMFQKLLDQIDVSNEAAGIYRSMAVRSMPKAFYSQDNIGHFGLASRFYTHFTAPIRRYPDLQIHRLIRTYIFEGKLDERTINYWQNNLEAIARQSSEREVAAVEAEREVTKMKMAEYMEQHIGEEFSGIVSGVTSFGLFIQLNNLVEGLVPITSLEGDYFDFVEELQSLVGKKSKKTYMIGDEIVVRCVAASKASSQIDFEIVKELKLENEPVKQKKLRN